MMYLLSHNSKLSGQFYTFNQILCLLIDLKQIKLWYDIVIIVDGTVSMFPMSYVPRVLRSQYPIFLES